MDELAKRRAENAKDGSLWSPLDALEEAHDKIKNCPNKTEVVIYWWEMHPDETRTLHYLQAGMNTPEHIAILTMALRQITEDWMSR